MHTDDRQLRLDHDVRPLLDTTFVVVDLETTGLRPQEDRITEVGAVCVRGGDRLGELQTLVHPERPVPPAITAVTGITDAMLRGAPRIATVLPTLLEFVRGSVLVAHNARFDTGFLDAQLTAHGYPRLANDVVDTARLARRLVRDEVRDLRLATLARFFRASTTPDHRALHDARATVDVLHGLLERAGAIGATTTEDLLDLQTSRSMHSFRKVSLAAGAPRAPGVYRFHDREDRVLYVGRTGDLRRRLRTYFGNDDRRRMESMVREAARVSWTVTATSIEASVLEQRELTARRPRFNRASTRPPRSVWLRWTVERFPRLSIGRTPGDDPTRVLGPLPGRRAATALVEAVEEVVPVRRCTFRIRTAQDHAPCVLKDLARCDAPCDGTVDDDGYAAAVRPVERLVAGDPGPVLDLLRRRMAVLSGDRRYEEAARVRSRLHRLAGVVHDVRRQRSLVAAGRIAVVRVGTDHLDAARLDRGLLTAAVRTALDDGVDGAAAALAAAPDVAPPTGRSEAAVRAEQMLVVRWLDRGTTVLVDHGGQHRGARPTTAGSDTTAPPVGRRGTPARSLVGAGRPEERCGDPPTVPRCEHLTRAWVEPVAGGRALADVVAEAAVVGRARRRDGQVLRGAKVVRRSDAA